MSVYPKNPADKKYGTNLAVIVCWKVWGEYHADKLLIPDKADIVTPKLETQATLADKYNGTLKLSIAVITLFKVPLTLKSFDEADKLPKVGELNATWALNGVVDVNR